MTLQSTIPIAPLPVTPFRSANNVLRLKALFFELGGASSAIYTLKDHDHGPYKSLRRLYLESDDPTEFRFYTTYLEGLKHWEALCAATWFKPYVAQWRKELLMRLQSSALMSLRKEAASGKNAFYANKYLLEQGWEAPAKTSRGRPSKQEISDAANVLALDDKRVAEDYERLISSSAGPVN